MRFDLKTPCKNCPFGVADTRIKFAARERAVEIEELAYREGFPCHLSGTLDEDKEDAGYEFGPNTQHCAGALGMFINGNYSSTPGTGNNDRLFERLERQLDLTACFESSEAFIEANTTERDRLEEAE